MAKRGRRAKDKSEVSDEALLIAYKIREARLKKYATAKEAAEKYGAGPSHWSHWETAMATPYKSALEKLAKFFGVNIDYFTTEPEDWESKKSEFLHELRGRARRQKDFYQSPDALPTDSGHDASHKGGEQGDAGLDIFMQIVELVSKARKKVDDGLMDGQTYDRHMKTISNMIDVSAFQKKK
jgi:Predicted transcriptional regulators